MAYVFKDNSIIGNLEAETDTFLEACFIETAAYHTLAIYDETDASFYKRIIVGRTGSGKTALLNKIVGGSTITKKSVIEAEKTIFDHIKNDKFISGLLQNGIDLKIFFKALWVHVILVKIIELLHGDINFLDAIKNSVIPNKRREKIIAYLDKYRHRFFDDEVLTEITKEFESGLKATVKFTGENSIKGDVTSAEKQKIQSETNNYVNRELLQSQKSIIEYLSETSVPDRQKKIIVTIDDLDKSWFQNDHVHFDFINALLEAFKELLSIRTVKILISIRTDILEGVYENKLKQDEKDLSLILSVEWIREDIRQLLDKRISYLLKDQYAQKRHPSLKDVFNFEVSGIPGDDLILNKTMLRPRDAIDFVNLCFRKARGQTQLNASHVIEAEENFYVSRKQALAKEWGGVHTQIGVYLDSLSLVKQREFSIESLNKDYGKPISDYIFTNNSDETAKVVEMFLKSDNFEEGLQRLLKIWFKIGVVGIKKSHDITIYSSFEKRQLDITDFTRTFVIHPLFWRY